MIRFILTALFVVLFLICSIPLMIIEDIIGKFSKDMQSRSSLAIVKWAFRGCLLLAGTDITVIGEENVPKDTPVLYVCNHRSNFDTVMTYVRVPGLTGYIAKKEMQRIPLLRTWMKYLHCLFLDRADIKQGMKTILEAVDKIHSGISIFIFPEGTTNKVNDTFLPFHEGSFKIAEKSGCPILPVSINNAADIFEDHFPKIKKTHVIIEYGKPIYMSEMPKKEKKGIGAKVRAIIQEMYFHNKELL